VNEESKRKQKESVKVGKFPFPRSRFIFKRK